MKKHITHYMFAICAMFIFLFATQCFSVQASASSKFYIKDGVLTGYRGDDTTVTIPSTVKTIDARAFAEKHRIETIHIPDSVTSIGENAFYRCTSLTTVTLSNSLKKISTEMFFDCSSLAEITIPDSVTEIEEYAFAGTKITSITIPKNVSSITHGALSSGPWYSLKSPLTKISVASDNKHYTIINDLLYTKDGTTLVDCPPSVEGTITLSPNLKECDTFLLNRCKNVTDYYIKNNKHYKTVDGILYSISGNTLVSCPKGRTKDVVVPSTVTKIQAEAFLHCKNIKNIKILYGTKKINDYAFFGCTSLTSLMIPDSVTYLGEYVFDHCNAMQSVTIPASVTSISKRSIKGELEEPEDQEDTLSSYYVDNGDFWTRDYFTVICPKNSYVYKMVENNAYPSFVKTYYYINSKAASMKTIRFNAASGSVRTSKKSVIANTSYGSLPAATRKGYEFLGWYTKKSGGHLVTSDSTCTTSRTLYAHWKKIKVKQVTLSGVTSAKKGQITVSLTPLKYINGYEICYSTNSKFKNAKTVKTAYTTKTIKNLSSQKKYYVKVRAYRFDSTNRKIYGSYNAVKKVKTQ